MEHIKALYFYPSPSTLVKCVTVLHHKNPLIAIICRYAVSPVLFMSAHITENNRGPGRVHVRGCVPFAPGRPHYQVNPHCEVFTGSVLCALSARYSSSPHACEAATRNHMLDPPVRD